MTDNSHSKHDSLELPLTTYAPISDEVRADASALAAIFIWVKSAARRKLILQTARYLQQLEQSGR